MLIAMKGSLLGINQDDKNKISYTMFNSIKSSYDLIGRKTGTKDHRAAQRAIVNEIISKKTSNERLVDSTSKALNISRRTLTRRIARR